MTTNTFEAVRACAIAILGGAVIQAAGVSAGQGLVIDWRTVKCGETMLEGADAFDAAQLLVALVGAEAALEAMQDDVEPAPVAPAPAPRVYAYMPNQHGARRRSFDAPGGFRVIVEPFDDDDAAQAAFVARLAELAERT